MSNQVKVNLTTGNKVTAKFSQGRKGSSFTYDDFTPEQLADLKAPLIAVAESVSEAEALRVPVEEGRVSAEQGRVTVEGQRVTAEQARAAAEALRVPAESGRASAEVGRVNAESSRVGAESSRVGAENTRIANENARLVFQTYNGVTAYVPGNKVAYNGSSYVCILASTGNLPTNTTYWLLIAQAGSVSEAQLATKADKLMATNLITNGAFSNGTTGWTASGSTNSVLNKVLTNTANGSKVNGQLIQALSPWVLGKKIYFKARIRVTNAICTSIAINSWTLGQGTIIAKSIVAPVQNVWYEVSGVVALTSGGSGNFDIEVTHNYADASTANGKVMEVQYVIAFDLTATFGASKEATADQVDNLLYEFLNSWFDGTKEVMTINKLYQISSADSLIASYTVASNKEIVVSAVDVDTDTFTSVGHGLVNGDVLYPTLNLNAGAVMPLQKYAGGMTQVKYFVVNKTTDTFQISTTIGGAALNLTTNANVDLTKWHFEKSPVTAILISSLPSKKKYMVKIIGKLGAASTNGLVVPSLPISWSNSSWAYSNGAYLTPIQPGTAMGAFMFNLEVEISSERPRISTIGYSVEVNNADSTKLVHTQVNNSLFSLDPTFIDNLITQISFTHGGGILNGTKVEVYSI